MPFQKKKKSEMKSFFEYEHVIDSGESTALEFKLVDTMDTMGY